MILPKELVRIRRREGRIILFYAGEDKNGLAKTLISVFEDSLGKSYGQLKEALDSCENLGYNYRLVRGLGFVLEQRCTLESKAAVNPIEARRAVFDLVGGKVISTDQERKRILAKASSNFGVKPEDMESSLYADLHDQQVVSEFRAPEPIELLREYNFAMTMAVILQSKRIELACKGRIEKPSKFLGESVVGQDGRHLKLSLELRPIKRVGVQSSKLERLIAQLMLQEDWRITAELLHSKKIYRLEMSKEKVGNLVAPKSLRKLISKPPSGDIQSKPLGDVILVEEMAAGLGITESEARDRLRRSKDLVEFDGVFISKGKLEEIRRELEKLEGISLAIVTHSLRNMGCRRPLQVLEALGYLIEWAESRDRSRVYRLKR